MAIKVWDRIKNVLDVFQKDEPEEPSTYFRQEVSYSRPDRVRLTRGNERSIVTAIYNRIAMDVAALHFNHVRLDDNGRYSETIDSPLNDCLTLNANIDQTGRALIQDYVLSLLDEGCVAIVKTVYGKYDSSVYEARVGKIVGWMPDRVRVSVYNERTMKKEEIVVLKSDALIIENPLYAVMNEPNSTLQRLIRKLNILDYIDEQSGSGKLDLIIQLPYTIKSQARQEQAEKRRAMIESQLKDTKYGIAYIDATEHVTQLNRSIENNLLTQIEYLTTMLYSQLGMTQSVLDGTADEKTSLNYNNRIIEPIASAFTDEARRKWLSRTARTQKQDIKFFQDPFKLVPVDNIAEIADKFTRNEIMSSNEVRQIIGMKPSKDPAADELRNKNLSESAEQIKAKNGEAVALEETSQTEPASKSSSGGASSMDAVMEIIEAIGTLPVRTGEIQNG